MRLCVVGSGYVGLVTAACFADSGNHVVGVDSDAAKVASLGRGQCPFYEPGLAELLAENLTSGRLRFTTHLGDGVAAASVVFIAVGTPPRADGSADLTMVEAVARQIAEQLRGPAVVVIKSTVPVGTGAKVEAIMRAATRHPVHLVSNPEFLKEGAAVDDFFRPDRVVVGAEDAAAGDLVAELYKPFLRNNKPLLRMSRAASELTKYASNAYLATRISFINEIAEVCEKFGVDVDEVRRGMGSDARIGQHFLYPGIGYGGSCFPKDVQALASFARGVGADCRILDAVHQRNRRQAEGMTERIVARLGEPLSGKKVAVWGVAFKPKTDDVREAPALAIVQALLERGVRIALHDPKALESARSALGARAEYCADAYEVLKGADALLICTEWNEFRSPDFDRIAAALRQRVIFDGRNLYDAATVKRYNLEYYSVGRPPVSPR